MAIHSFFLGNTVKEQGTDCKSARAGIRFEPQHFKCRGAGESKKSSDDFESSDDWFDELLEPSSRAFANHATPHQL